MFLWKMQIKKAYPSVHFLRRITAILVIFAFVFVDAVRYAPYAYAQPVADPKPVLFSISRELGKIDEVYFKPRTTGHAPRDGSLDPWPVARKTIVFIQDAHDSLEAQENIAKLIGKFVKEQGIKTVFEEGYEGPVPTEKFFGFIKDAKTKQKVSYFLLDKLRVGGAEYAHINRAEDFKLIGVEDLKLYAENLKCYKDSSRNQKNIAEDLGELFSQITTLANQYFPKDLKTWLKRKELFSEGKLPLLSYLKELQGLFLAGRQGRSEEQFSKEYPAISILLAVQATHNPKLVPQLNALDSKVVFEEIIQIEKAIANASLQNERDQGIFAYYQGLSLLKRLNRMELTQAEYEAAREVLQKFETQKLANLIALLTHRSLVLSKAWEQHIQDAIQFYNVAQGRDRSVDSHLQEFLRSKEEDTAILVFGGFHANGIKEILKEQGLSYVVISPRITSMDKRHQDYYKRLMSEGHHSFEIPFLAARANKPPSVFFSAATSEEIPVLAELHAISSSVEKGASDPQLIERNLAIFNQPQELQKADGTSQPRSEMRNKNDSLKVPEILDALRQTERVFEDELQRGNGRLSNVNTIQDLDGTRDIIHDRRILYIPKEPGELIVIGDLHGDIETLEVVLQEADFLNRIARGENIKVLFLGDAIANREKDSIVTMLRLLKLKRLYPEHFFYIAGNQELDVLQMGIRDGSLRSDKVIRGELKKQNDMGDEFVAELIQNYGIDDAVQITKAFALVVQKMSRLALFGNGLVAVHGGPVSLTTLDNYPDPGISQFMSNEKWMDEIANIYVKKDLAQTREDLEKWLAAIAKLEPKRHQLWQLEDGIGGEIIVPKLQRKMVGINRVQNMLDAFGGTLLVHGHDHLPREKLEWVLPGLLTLISGSQLESGTRYAKFDLNERPSKVVESSSIRGEKPVYVLDYTKPRSETRDAEQGAFEREDAKVWTIRDSKTGAEKGFVYRTPLVPEEMKDLAQAWRDFHAMVFGFPKLLEHAARERKPVVLVLPEKLDGFGPLADQAPWIEGARTALAWASAYFRFKDLGNVDLRVLQLPSGRVPENEVAEAVKMLSSREIQDTASTPEKKMEARMFRLAEVLKSKKSSKPGLSLELRDLSEITAEEKKPVIPEIIRPELPPIPEGKKRIVLTGAAGFIGINLVKRLLEEGHQVIALDNFISANKDFLSFFQGEPNFYFKKWDVSEPFDVEGPVDQVLHLASLASPPDYYGRPRETLRAGLEATREAVELARRKHARFLFTSTSEVYGDAKVHPQSETYEGNVSPYLKRSQYDESKRGAETLLKLYSERYAQEGLDLRMMRIFNTYGPFMRIDDGRVITNFIDKVLKGEPIEIYGNENITRSFGYVDDTVNGLLKVLRTDQLDASMPLDKRVFNIGNDSEFTLGELANLTNALGRKYLNRAVPVHIVEVKDPSDPTRRRPDLSRARAVLNYAPRVALAQGLEKTFVYFLSARSEARISAEERKVLEVKGQQLFDYLAVREEYVSGQIPEKSWIPLSLDSLHLDSSKNNLAMVLGTWDERTAHEAARVIKELRARGFQIKVLTSGKYGNKPGVFYDNKGNQLPEAVWYKKIMEEDGVFVDFVEPRSTNSGENIVFSKELLDKASFKPDVIFEMQNPIIQRRAGLSVVRQYFGSKEAFDASGVRLISYAPYMPETAVQKDSDLLRDIGFALTELQSINKYPEKGFTIPAVIPEKVARIANDLASLLTKIKGRPVLQAGSLAQRTFDEKEIDLEIFDPEDVHIGLEISPDVFNAVGMSRFVFDRAHNQVLWDGQPVRFSDIPVRANYRDNDEMQETYEKGHADRGVYALPNGNLGLNNFYLAAAKDKTSGKGKVFYYANDPLVSRPMLVVKSGAKSGKQEKPVVMLVSFRKEKDGTVRMIDSSGKDITDDVEVALYGLPVIRDGRLNLKETLGQLDDLRHLFRFPRFDIVEADTLRTEWVDQVHLGMSDGIGIFYKDPYLLERLFSGRPVALSVDPLLLRGVTFDEIKAVYDAWGYRGKYSLDLSTRTVTATYEQGTHPHSYFGVTQSGKIFVGALSGALDTHFKGISFEGLYKQIRERHEFAKDPVQYLWIWANGKDVSFRPKGPATKGMRSRNAENLIFSRSVRSKAASANPLVSASTKGSIRSEVREPEKAGKREKIPEALQKRKKKTGVSKWDFLDAFKAQVADLPGGVMDQLRSTQDIGEWRRILREAKVEYGDAVDGKFFQDVIKTLLEKRSSRTAAPIVSNRLRRGDNGRYLVCYLGEDFDYIIKTYYDADQKKYIRDNWLEAFAYYTQPRLLGLAVPTFIVDTFDGRQKPFTYLMEDGSRRTADIAIIQRKVTPLLEYLKRLVRSGETEKAKTLIDEFKKTMIAMFRRGVVDADFGGLLANYGIDEKTGKVFVFDFGDLTTGAEKAYEMTDFLDDVTNKYTEDGLRTHVSNEIADYFKATKFVESDFTDPATGKYLFGVDYDQNHPETFTMVFPHSETEIREMFANHSVHRSESRDTPSFTAILSYKDNQEFISDPRKWKLSKLDKKYYAEMSQWDSRKLGAELQAFFRKGILVPINDSSLLEIPNGEEFLSAFIDHLIYGAEKDEIKAPGAGMSHYWGPADYSPSSFIGQTIIKLYSKKKFEEEQSRYRALLVRLVEYWDQLAAQSARSEMRVVDRDVAGKWLLPGVTIQQEHFDRVPPMPEEYYPILHVNINGKAYAIGHGDYLVLTLPSGKKIYWSGQHNLSYAFFFKHFGEQADDRLGEIPWRHADQHSDLNIGSLHKEAPPKSALLQQRIAFGLETLNATNYLGFIQSRKLAKVEHASTTTEIDAWNKNPANGVLDIDLDILVNPRTAELQNSKIFAEKLAATAKTAEVIFITNSSELQAIYPQGELRPGFPKYLHPDEAIKFGMDLVKEISQKDVLRSEMREQAREQLETRMKQEFAQYGITYKYVESGPEERSGNRIKLLSLPEEAPWIMDALRPVNKETPIMTAFETMPAVTSVFDPSQMPLLDSSGTNSQGIFLGMIRRENGEVHPAAIKMGDVELKELKAIQVYGNHFGIYPEFYGVLKDGNGKITGYAMSLVALDKARGVPPLDHPDEQEIRKRVRGIVVTTMFTRKGRAVGIDAGVILEEASDRQIEKIKMGDKQRSEVRESWWRNPSKLFLAMSVPIFSLRRAQNDPGIGKYTDIAPYYRDVLSKQGIQVLQFLPFCARLDGSPFAPVSFYALDELYIDWSSVPEVASHPALLAQLIASKDDQSKVHYANVRSREKGVMEQAFAFFQDANPERKAAFEAFKKKQSGWLDEYATFVAIHTFIHEPAYQWTEMKLAAIQQSHAKEVSHLTELHKFAQWIAYGQLTDALTQVHEAGGKALFDMPMFQAKDSVGVWKHQNEYFHDVATRNPGVVKQGINENWTDLALWNWDALRKENFKFKLDPFRHWLEFGFDGARNDALHFAYFFPGELGENPQSLPGDDYPKKLLEIFWKYGGLPFAEAFEEKGPHLQGMGFVVVDGNWKRLSTHDDPRFAASVDLLDSLHWGLNPNGRSFESARFLGMTLGDLWLDPEPIKVVRERTLENGQSVRRAFWNYRIPLPGDLDYDRRVRLNMAPYLKFKINEATGLFSREWPEDTDLVRPLLAAAADSFIRRDQDGRVEIWTANRDWMLQQWGRSTFIALPGLLLARGRFEDAKNAIRNFARYEKEGLLPNRIFINQDPKTFEYNSADAPMWFIQAIKQYWDTSSDKDFVLEMLPVMERIMMRYALGTSYLWNGAEHRIYMDQDGLIVTPAGASWMDVESQGGFVTPRNGKAVEINALWYANLRFLEKVEKFIGDDQLANGYANLARDVQTSFNYKFWNGKFSQDPNATPLFDVIEGDSHQGAIRPNMIFAVSHGEDLLSQERQKAVFDSVTRELLTPYGLRTLSPHDSYYHPFQWQDDRTNHQGTVHPWLLGPYIDALIKIRGGQGIQSEAIRKESEKILKPLLGYLLESPVGSLPGLFDGGDPRQTRMTQDPRGTRSQAWSVAEILRSSVRFEVLPAKQIFPRSETRENPKETVKLDPNWRLKIPAGWKSWQDYAGKELVLRFGEKRGEFFIWKSEAYPMPNVSPDKVLESLRARRMLRWFGATTASVTMDQQGRISVPKVQAKNYFSDLPGPVSLEDLGDRIKVTSTPVRSEVRSTDVVPPAAPVEEVSVAKDRADRMVRSIRKNEQQATVFVDAEDFQNFSKAQKQEYLVLALSNKALRVVVYNERGQFQDHELDALLKLERVTRTGKDLSGAQASFDRPNAPSIHLSKQVLPEQALVQRLRKRVSFFKAQGQKSGTLAAALLWAWSGGEDARLREVSQGQDGFWIVAETLVNALQKSYDANIAFAIAA